MLKKVRKHSAFLKWFIMFILISIASVWGYQIGLIETIHKADRTKLTFAIYIIFLIFSVNLGKKILSFSRKDSCSLDDLEVIERENDSGWFVSDLIYTMGMIGTVFGFIFMLQTSFAGINTESIKSIKIALMTMSTGMSTALFTTASGLICGSILKIQLFIFNQDLCKAKERIS